MRKIIALFFMTSFASLMAADGAFLYKKCIACHGANAQKSALGKSQVISDWSANKMIAALKGYKDGSYGGSMKSLMQGQVGSLSDEDIEAVSNYIVTLK